MRKSLVLFIACFVMRPAFAVPADQQSFATPEAAVQALVGAAQAGDHKAMLGLLGPLAEPLIDSGDAVADRNSRDRFLAAYRVKNSLDKSDPAKVVLTVGTEDWPFPIPISQRGGKWFWDSAAGAQEMIDRRVGENELATIQSCFAYVDAQREFYVRNVQKDPLQHFAGRLISTPGRKDGLYWPTTKDESPSPLGEEFAQARAEGYLQANHMPAAAGARSQPFHGYVYRLLTRQGANAPGGPYDYMVNGELLGGFGLVAFPAEYGSSGIMTFIVNHDGVVYSRDLGPDTVRAAMAMREFNPDSMWTREKE
jgi:hypothetical protein